MTPVTSGSGFHVHLFGVAVFDLLLTILGLWLVVFFTEWNFSLLATLVFAMAFAFHVAFGVNEPPGACARTVPTRHRQ